MQSTTWTIDAIRSAMQASGSHWFDPDTMRFFKSRVLEPCYQGPGGVYFVTTEKPPYGPRRASVRQFDPELMKITTIGTFCSLSNSVAHRRAAFYAGGGEHPEQ
jgi:hypothetical protein